MLGITKESRTEKTKRTTQDVVSYLQEIVRDERLRAHLRAAIDHGAEVSHRAKKAIEADGMSTRLATDESYERTSAQCSTTSMMRAIGCVVRRLRLIVFGTFWSWLQVE